ncbi:cytochrome c oxidase subunit VB-domain-containing protein [Multifurca ochricompacta]|uniref:Cytochrome c oxidase subunit VB-domain-containing protein n=1 Tax=Multifurca ochricompacta TaxID=376703 RepID=A0AAD4M6I3_9AGAM|nr:cytochrome c oxidase subunit VB-domain-containing protein [Multifurca ochricompacta]
MLHIALRSVRSSVLTSRAGLVRPSSAFRALSTSAIRRSDDHHAAAPSIYGVGAKPGEIPTDESQSTGLDRVQVLGLLEGVDVFDLEPLDSTRIGTLADPIKVFSTDNERIVGCTGSPADSHDVLWFRVTTEKPSRCPECGSAHAIDFASDAPVVSEVAPQDPAHAHAH